VRHRRGLWSPTVLGRQRRHAALPLQRRWPSPQLATRQTHPGLRHLVPSRQVPPRPASSIPCARGTFARQNAANWPNLRLSAEIAVFAGRDASPRAIRPSEDLKRGTSPVKLRMQHLSNRLQGLQVRTQQRKPKHSVQTVPATEGTENSGGGEHTKIVSAGTGVGRGDWVVGLLSYAASSVKGHSH